MTTAYITHQLFADHEVPQGHPECPARLAAIEDQLHASQIFSHLEHHKATPATRDQIERVHTGRLITELQSQSPSSGIVPIDPDTFMGTHTLHAAWHAAGAGVLATRLVTSGNAQNAFCAVRPPGHHACRDLAMGFCFFNNIAVAAAFALEECGLERVAILDFDVHHGNGTDNIFAGDERVLVCSSFQHPFYPFGEADNSHPNIVDVPLPAGTGSETFRTSIRDHWLPAVTRFEPQMIFISAGFDGHIEDDMAHFNLVDDDYRWVTETIMELAHRHADGRIVSCLEGGYALNALGRCVSIHVQTLAGL